MNALSFSGIVKSFGARRVLDGAAGHAKAGRVVGLLGRNGEGKTTLLKILLDLLEPEAGQVEVLGLRPDGSGKIRQHVGYVPEKPAFHPFMTAGEVLSLRARLFERWDAGRAESLCRRLGLDLTTQIASASKGTLGKLAWVCATAHDPALLLLDEPTSGLDVLVREEVLSGLVAELGEEGKTVLVTSHRMDEFAGLLDEVWVMAQGRLAGCWPVEELREQACVVSGRPKEGSSMPEISQAVALPQEGPLRAWAILDRRVKERLLGSNVLESIQVESLPLERAFTCLLTLYGGQIQ